MNSTITIRNTQTGEIRQVPQEQLGSYGLGDGGGINLPSSIHTLGGLSFNNFDDLLRQYFPPAQVQNARNIMGLESSGNPFAIGDNFPINGEVRPSFGLFQVRTFPDRPAPNLLMDPRTNIEYAANLYRHQGWAPWYNSARKLGLI